ncbi:hypothetical protein HED55_12350 [Ochrobactrum haematophilum]|uniref:Uncharacterized protein n=1 Tax=Brucella haematophila TaxID=419474 RepID=A0ABX1DLF4_9HYPH|nr:hypothetical protein [Brucella haematophila]
MSGSITGHASDISADLPGTSGINMRGQSNSHEALARAREQKFDRLVGDWGNERKENFATRCNINRIYRRAEVRILRTENIDKIDYTFTRELYTKRWYKNTTSSFRNYRKVRLHELVRGNTIKHGYLETKALKQTFKYFGSNEKKNLMIF